MKFKSLIFPHCWVCGIRFKTSKPPGQAMEERHHIVPQAFGGKDGPEVSLCSDHHACLHQVALRIKRGAPHNDLLVNESPVTIPKILWLANAVVKAEQVTGNDPNKRVKVILSADVALQNKISQLQKIYSCNKPKILEKAISYFWKSHFGA